MRTKQFLLALYCLAVSCSVCSSKVVNTSQVSLCSSQSPCLTGTPRKTSLTTTPPTSGQNSVPISSQSYLLSYMSKCFGHQSLFFTDWRTSTRGLFAPWHPKLSFLSLQVRLLKLPSGTSGYHLLQIENTDPSILLLLPSHLFPNLHGNCCHSI